MTTLDPSVVKSDKLVGSIAGLPGKLPPVWDMLTLETHLLERVVGAKDKLVVDPVKKGEILMMNINAAATVGVVQDLGKNTLKCALKRPVCAEKGARVAMSRRVGQRWRLIGYGIGILFGFTNFESIIIGTALIFSSTIIGLKLLPTTVLHHRRIGEIIISILLLQDLLAILVLVFLQASHQQQLIINEIILLVLMLASMSI